MNITAVTIQEIEAFIAQFPIYEYRIIDAKEIDFSERVRYICEHECDRYGTTWACPPGVGTLSACESKCRRYDSGFFFSSVAEVQDIMNFKELLSTRMEHEKITDAVKQYFLHRGIDCYTLSTESCEICDVCTYPAAPCRFPEKMNPCVESHGIVVAELVEKYNMEYNLGGNTVLWFSLILLMKGLSADGTSPD
ncbi:MAG: DUF2284 domain-containing protein [Lachnospiraceae bacterium]